MKETLYRILSGLIIAAVVLLALFWSAAYYLAVLIIVMLVGILGFSEYVRLAQRGSDGRPFRIIGLIIGLGIIIAYYGEFLHLISIQGAGSQASGSGGMLNQGLNGGMLSVLPDMLQSFTRYIHPGYNISPVLIVILFIAAFFLQILMRPLEGSLYSAASTVFGVVYVFIPISFALPILAYANAPFYIIFIALGPILTDIGAYFAGRWFGRHNAGLKVSPKKTYEGYLGGFILCLIGLPAFLYLWNHVLQSALGYGPNPLGYIEVLILSPFISALSVLGDLAESAIKRDAKMKDSASVIPGHGGTLDLIDAILFVLPLGYFYLSLRMAASGS